MGYRYDWEKIKADYISDPLSSCKKISKKYHISMQSVSKHCREEHWVDAKKAVMSSTSEKVISAVATKKAGKIARLAAATDKMVDSLERALDDPDQFFRYFVQETASSGGETVSAYVDKVSPKLDTKALREATQALKAIEDLTRGLNSLRKADELNRERREADRLKLEREKFEWEKEKVSKKDGEAGEFGVLILPEVLQEDDDGKE